MTQPRPEFQPASLMADVLGSANRLLQGEIALLRAEVRQRGQSAQTAIVLGVVAAALGITALNVLAGAAIAAIVAVGLAPHWATLLVGAGLICGAAFVSRLALVALRGATAGPLRAKAHLQQDTETLQSLVVPHGKA